MYSILDGYQLMHAAELDYRDISRRKKQSNCKFLGFALRPGPLLTKDV